MKVLAPLFAFFALASAQGLTIGTPKERQRIPLQRPFTVQVIKNVRLVVSLLVASCQSNEPSSSTHSQPHILSSIEVAITIGIVPCHQASGCPNPSAVGNVLYKGPYNPQPHGVGGYYQNFTVVIPFDEALIIKEVSSAL